MRSKPVTENATDEEGEGPLVLGRMKGQLAPFLVTQSRRHELPKPLRFHVHKIYTIYETAVNCREIIEECRSGDPALLGLQIHPQALDGQVGDLPINPLAEAPQVAIERFEGLVILAEHAALHVGIKARAVFHAPLEVRQEFSQTGPAMLWPAQIRRRLRLGTMRLAPCARTVRGTPGAAPTDHVNCGQVDVIPEGEMPTGGPQIGRLPDALNLVLRQLAMRHITPRDPSPSSRRILQGTRCARRLSRIVHRRRTRTDPWRERS